MKTALLTAGVTIRSPEAEGKRGVTKGRCHCWGISYDKGFWSVRINDQWRIVFKWIDNDAYDVKIADYQLPGTQYGAIKTEELKEVQKCL